MKRSYLHFLTTSLVFASMPAFAIVQQPTEPDVSAEAVPEGFIVVKVQPSDVSELSGPNPGPQPVTDRRHPDYVRCRMEPVAGSILKKRKICMTNHEWDMAIRLGNKYAREFVADNQPGFMLP